MTRDAGVLLLARSDLAELLTPAACLAAVEAALCDLAEGRAPESGILAYPGVGGGFHVKAAALGAARSYFAAKINANFPENPARLGLPTIQGVVLLCDATDGRPLALLDSGELTVLRTAAATAAAARRLARPESRVAALCGCGAQAMAQLRALADVLPIDHALVWDVDGPRAGRFAREAAERLGLAIAVATAPREATRDADVCVTCTPSRKAFLSLADLKPGTFVAAVGADAPEKRELAGDLLAAAKIVVDSLAQCARIGELHHALAEGSVTADSVHSELADVVAKKRAGRETPDEITVFDSTGIALEDVAAAAAVYERAVAAGRGVLWRRDA